MKRWARVAAALPLVGALAASGLVLWAKGPRARPQLEGLRSLPGALAAPGEPPATLRVLTFNIGYGGGLAGDKEGSLRSRSSIEARLQQIARQIKAVHADIALLQEVDLAARRTQQLDEVAWLAEATGLRHTATAVTWSKRYVPYPYWPPRRHFGALLSGQAVLSRFPVVAQHLAPLPQPEENPFWYNWFYLERVYQQVDLDLGGGPRLTVVNLHLEAFVRAHRERQAKLVAELLRRTPGARLIVGGDLNCVPPEALRRKAFPDEPATDMDGETTIPTLLQSRPGLRDVFSPAAYAAPGAPLTFPADAPNRKLDYLFYDEAGFALESAWVPVDEPTASDHRSLAAVLQLR